jgi:hypothetical protein
MRGENADPTDDGVLIAGENEEARTYVYLIRLS